MVKQTGGKFNPAQRHIYFLAGNRRDMEYASPFHDYLLLAVNEINTPEDEQALRGLIASGKHMFLDSGVYNLATTHAKKNNVTMDIALSTPPEDIDDFENLFKRYCSLVGELGNELWGYIEIDQGGRENKIQTRAKLEALGFAPIPVYHPLNDGWDYFDDLAQNYDRICFGNIVNADRHTRRKLLATLSERHERYPDLWVHVLGLTPNEWMNAYPADSADSSAWLGSVRWSGYIPRAMGASMGFLHKNYQYLLGSDADSERGAYRAKRMAAYGSSMMQRNWQNHLRAFNEN